MRPIKVMVVGDVHGGSEFIVPKIKVAGEAGITHVVVCGDCGLWDHKFEGVLFLDRIQRAAEDNNLSVFFVPGNHENHDHWEWYLENLPKARGWTYVRSRVLLSPKAHKWTWAGKQFVAAGGAVSIDRDYRLQRESGFYYDDWKSRHVHRTPEPRTLWWDNEQLTDENVQTIRGWNVKADYLFTHDCSNRTPFFNRIKPDIDSQVHRQRIDEVLKSVRPEMHFHGHMHDKFDWMNLVGVVNGEPHYTQTYGLECNNGYDSWGTLDVETGRFVWHQTKFRDTGEVSPIEPVDVQASDLDLDMFLEVEHE